MKIKFLFFVEFFPQLLLLTMNPEKKITIFNDVNLKIIFVVQKKILSLQLMNETLPLDDLQTGNFADINNICFL